MTAFDLPVNRRHTSSEKWDGLATVFGTEDVLPLWVADMDFKAPQAVIEALQRRAAEGVFGYTFMAEGYKEAVVSWMKKRHGWTILPESIVFSPGVVPALYHIVAAFTKPGDQVIIQPPVYPPFSRVVTNQGRELVLNPLKELNGTYTMDFDHLKALMNDKVKMLILCNPHNPVGRAWKRGELQQLAAIAEKYGVLIVSDEIHGDLTFKPAKHVPFASVSDFAANYSIICTAPSKTFNLAAMQTANIIIQNPDLRQQLNGMMRRHEAGGISAMGLAATEAAYNHGESWLTECLAYTRQNLEYVHQHTASYLDAEGLPLVASRLPEATYLLWLDFRRLGMNPKDLEQFMVQEARLGMNSGHTFGKAGEGFMRMNLACSRDMAEEAMKRLDAAIGKLLRR